MTGAAEFLNALKQRDSMSARAALNDISQLLDTVAALSPPAQRSDTVPVFGASHTEDRSPPVRLTGG